MNDDTAPQHPSEEEILALLPPEWDPTARQKMLEVVRAGQADAEAHPEAPQTQTADTSGHLSDEEILAHFSPNLSPSDREKILQLVKASQNSAEALSKATGVKIGVSFGRHFRGASADGTLTDAEILARLPAEMSQSERQTVVEKIQAGQVRSRAFHAIAQHIAESGDEPLSDADILAQLPAGMSAAEEQQALVTIKALAAQLKEVREDIARRLRPDTPPPDER